MTTKIAGRDIQRGMKINGREIVRRRPGTGSGKNFLFLKLDGPDANGMTEIRVAKGTRYEVEA